MKFNLALRPQTKNQQLIQLANQFSHVAESYLIGEQSLPHLTLSHFFAKESDLENIWESTCKSIQAHTIHLKLTELSYTTFNQTTYWIALVPDKFDQLKQMHLIVADIIKHPVSRAYDRYDPHVTLINTKNDALDSLIKEVEKNFVTISDEFVLSLGKTDEAGQFTEIIKSV